MSCSLYGPLHSKPICKHVNQLCINYYPCMRYASMSEALPCMCICIANEKEQMWMQMQGAQSYSQDRKRKDKWRDEWNLVEYKSGLHAWVGFHLKSKLSTPYVADYGWLPNFDPFLRLPLGQFIHGKANNYNFLRLPFNV